MDETCKLDVETSREEFPIDLDLPPEYCQYRDEGCELAASCLRCPFPTCMYERKGEGRRWLRQRRDREIVRLVVRRKKSIQELAARFGVSPRTVRRTLKSANVPLPPAPQPVCPMKNKRDKSRSKRAFHAQLSRRIFFCEKPRNK